MLRQIALVSATGKVSLAEVAQVAAAGAAQPVAPDDPAALRAALLALIADPDARDRLGARALAAARGPYSWDGAARETLALYRSL